MQLKNRLWAVELLLPTHVRRSTAPVNLASFSLPAEAFDDAWYWQKTNEHGKVKNPSLRDYRPISDLEMALYLHQNLLETSSLLPYGPPSVFVRKHRGCFDRLLLFAPHPCTTDPFYYSAVTFRTSTSLLERCFRSIEVLTTGDRRLMSKCALQRPVLAATFLSLVHGVVWIQSTQSEQGMLGQLFQIRAYEKARGRAFSFNDFSSELRRIAVRHLCQSSDLADLEAYEPRCLSTEPPSIIEDLIIHFGSLRLGQMAQREEEAEAGLIGPGDFDFKILEDARVSTVWTNRLIDAGVDHVFLEGPTQFRRGLRQYKHGAVYQDKLRHYGLASAFEDALLYLKPHFDNAEDPEGALRGHLSSQKQVHVYSSKIDVSTLSKCSDCRAAGLQAYAIPWDEAALGGHLADYADTDKICGNIDARLAAIKREVERSGRLHLRFKEQLLRASYGLEDESLFMLR